MRVTEIAVKKPVAIIMITIALILIGIMGYTNLGADLMPKANIPVVMITTIYPGAGAEEIDKDVVKPIEDAVSVISGVDKVRSTASEGYARTVVMFKLSQDPNVAMMDAQKAVDSIANKLPKDAMKPTLYKFDDSDQPILVYTIYGDIPYDEMHNKAENIKERIETIQGVGNVSLFGDRKKELVVKIDKTKAEFYGLTVDMVANYLRAQNVSIPGGTIYQPEQNKIVRVEGEFSNINDIKNLRIPLRDGFVELYNVADVSLEYPRIQEITQVNGKSAIGISIKKQSDANIVMTGSKIKAEVENIKTKLKGVQIETVEDSTTFITSSLSETQRSLIEGVITTALVLFIFLRQWRSVFVVLCSIPTSLITTFFMMYEFGFTLNMLSLMGLALCVGILVDDSIVVLENIHRHIKMGKDPEVAAVEGRNEIGMAAIAITLCDIVVFAPIAFMSGIVGQYFKQFGLTVVFATLLSLAVSFTLTPMLASRLFKKENEEKEEKKASRFDNIGKTFLGIYQKTLLWALSNRLKVMIVIVVLIVSSAMLIVNGFIGTEFIPKVDEGTYRITINLTPGATLDKTQEKVKQAEEFIKKIPELDYYYTHIGDKNLVNKADIFVSLKEKKDRKRTVKEVVEATRDWAAANMTGVSFTAAETQSMGSQGSTGKAVDINIKGPKVDVIREVAKNVESIVRNTEGTTEIDNSLKSGNPEFNVKIDRFLSSSYGVNALDVSNVIRSSIEGTKAGVFRQEGEEYDIRVKLMDNQVLDMNDVGNLQISNNGGQSVPLNQISSINLDEGPAVINRIDKQRSVTISANLRNGYLLGDITSQIQKKLDEMPMPDGYTISFGGEQQNMKDSFKPLIQALILSIVLVYMILVVLYESFLTPFVRILALPVGSIGAIIMLTVSGNSINIMTMIGFIMLDGLAAKNGTLLIDYTNTLMSRGMPLREALYEAGSTRLKPIWMTSFTMMVGMLPSALALGDGAEYKSGMGLALIGGMITSTIISPILLPVAYTLIDDLGKLIKRLFNKNNEIQESI